MICPKCNGRGTVGYFHIDHFVDIECDRCHGSGEVPMTNEEWLRSCTTEQLVIFLAKQKCDGCNDEPYDEKHGTCKYCMEKKTEQVREWLNQPHTFIDY